jgi:hypothetical protein
LSDPIKQHFVPKFYLKNFTQTRKDNGPLYVFDKTAGCWRPAPSTPKDEARADHINTIFVDGSPGFMVENFLAGIEDRAAPVIRNIISRQMFPLKKEEIARFVGFVGSAAVRTPGYRELYKRFMGKVFVPAAFEACEEDLKQFPSMRKSFQGFVEQNLDQVLSHEEMVGAMPSIALYVSETLLKRGWSLILADPKGPYFITSDNPVTGLFGDVTIPLSPLVAAVAWQNGCQNILNGDDRFVLYVNWKTFMNARAVVYSHQVDECLAVRLQEFGERNGLKTEIDFLEELLRKR